MTLLALVAPSLGAVHTVGTDADFASIQEAVNAAADGDLILVEQADDARVVVDGRQLEIEAIPGVTVGSMHFIDSQAAVTGLAIADSFVVEGGSVDARSLHFAGKGRMDGPAVTVVRGSASFMATAVTDWDAPGSPVEVYGGSARFVSFDAQRTSGHQGGAVHVYDGEVSIELSHFGDTFAYDAGGAIAASGGTVSVSSSAFEDGRAPSGGAFAALGGDVSAVDIDSSGFKATYGGHVYVGAGSFSVTRGVFSGGEAVSGAGMAIDGGSATVTNCVFADAEWADVGGAVYIADGSLDMQFSVLARNTAGLGGGVALEGGEAHFEGVIIAHNSAEAIAAAGTGSATFRHGLTWDNSGVETTGNVHMGAGAFAADPMFRRSGDWLLASYSPALDAGPPGQVDHDLTAPDMGIYGGSEAWVLADADGDGHVEGRDCDDSDPDSFEYAVDAWYDGIDHDCRANSDFDMDGDGHDAHNFGGDDCDDSDAERSPSRGERDGDDIDADCDGLVDIDSDGDGWEDAIDCDDDNPDVHPANHDEPYDGIDSDCRGDDDFDADGDGYARGVDCDDSDPSVHPGAPEISDDGLDQDCDGADLDSSEPDSTDSWVTSPAEDEVPWAPTSPPSYAVTSGGCSSTPLPNGLAAALLALAGSLLLRRRDW